MKEILILQRMALPLLLLLLLAMFSCEDDNDTQPEEQPACRIQSFFFTQPNGTIDSNVYTFESDGRIASFKRMARAVDKTISPIRDGELSYNAQGLLDQVRYPLTEGVLTLQYNNQNLTKLEYKEKGVLVQEYEVTTNAQGKITSMTGKGLNNAKMLYTINDEGIVSKWERFDQAGNKVAWNFYENLDRKLTHPLTETYPGMSVWVQNNIATLSFDPQINSGGAWQSSTTYTAMDAQGNYNGVIKEVKTNAEFKATKEGFIYSRTFTNSNGASGNAQYRYTNCTE